MTKRAVIAERILVSLAREPGYFCPKQIAADVDAKVRTVNGALGNLVRYKDVEYRGTARTLGIEGFRADTRFYGLPGAARIDTTPQTAPVRGFEFRLRRRDPFADHAQLAMTTRGAR